jgi:hypothetical protein
LPRQGGGIVVAEIRGPQLRKDNEIDAFGLQNAELFQHPLQIFRRLAQNDGHLQTGKPD